MKRIINYSVLLMLLVWMDSCRVPLIVSRQEQSRVPAAFINAQDTINSARIRWRDFYKDPNLVALIDSALQNNQELNILMQEIEISKNEIRIRKGEYLPFLNFNGGMSADKAGKYTWDGFSEEDLKQNPGRGPKYIGDFMIGTYFSWELDVWKKLRNAKKAATLRYMATQEGKNYLVTQMVAEIAGSYYELIALDNLLDIVRKNIGIQENALEVVKMEKDAAKVTQLAVNRFEAQLLYTRNLQFEIMQQITEAENRINFLTGRFPGPVPRSSGLFNNMSFDDVREGIPSQMLMNRPDIRQAAYQLAASKLDVKSAKANFYPSFQITAGLGLQAFNPTHLVHPESILYNLGGDLAGPLINRNAIKAMYFNANAQQIQAVYNFERSILNAHIEVVNQLVRMNNFTNSYETKLREVEILNNSVTISNNLFRSARADYIEVLLTQREALESTMDLTEIKLKQLTSKVNIYKALGGGWN